MSSTPMRDRASAVGLFSLLLSLSLSAPAMPAMAQDEPDIDADGESATDTDADGAEPMAYSDDGAAYASGPAATETLEQTAAPDAEEEEPAATTDVPLPSAHLDAELAFFAGSDDVGSRLTISPLFNVGFAASETIAVGVTWGLGIQSDGPDMGDSASTVALGNPYLWIGRHSQSGRTHFTFGGGVALPVATLPDNVSDAAIAGSAYLHATAARGDYNRWLWAPDKLTTVVSFAGDAILDDLYVAGDAAVGMMFPTTGDGTAAAVGQFAAEVGYATNDVRVVMRAQAAAIVTPEVDDILQFSIDPYVTWNLTEKVALNGRLTVNLDNPTGFDGMRIWALRLGTALRF